MSYYLRVAKSNCKLVTRSVWPDKAKMRLPWRQSHTMIVPSSDPVAAYWWHEDMLVTPLVCPYWSCKTIEKITEDKMRTSKTKRHRGVEEVSHTRKVPSSDPLTTCTGRVPGGVWRGVMNVTCAIWSVCPSYKTLFSRRTSSLTFFIPIQRGMSWSWCSTLAKCSPQRRLLIRLPYFTKLIKVTGRDDTNIPAVNGINPRSMPN